MDDQLSGSDVGAARAFARQRNPLLRRARRLTRPAWLGTLRRTGPLSDHWGNDRGTPIDRHYIEQFLTGQASDIRGRVLEIKDTNYTTRYGHDVERSDVLDINPANPRATIIADLADATTVADEQFDCFILTQTLQLIYDLRSAIAHAHRLLRPGGVLLVTVPTVSRILRGDDARSDYWRFTPASCERLFAEAFGAEQVTLHRYGNVLTEIAFLTGLAREELRPRELEMSDPSFPLLIGIRAVKRAGHDQDGQ